MSRQEADTFYYICDENHGLRTIGPFRKDGVYGLFRAQRASDGTVSGHAKLMKNLTGSMASVITAKDGSVNPKIIMQREKWQKDKEETLA